MPGAADPWEATRRRVAHQASYLRNPLEPAPGICYVCRGPADPRWTRCYACEQHLATAQSKVANVVVPISYAVKRQQHAYALAAYKAAVPSPAIQLDLLNLLLVFVADHHGCIARAARVDRWTHLAVVPSTKGRPGEHPLRALIGDRIQLPWAELTANPKIPSDSRKFHPDRFSAGEDLGGAQILLLDDTWTTGSRVQSASYALRKAGASKVAAIVLGRHVNPEYDGWKPILQAIRDVPYRQDVCAVHCRD